MPDDVEPYTVGDSLTLTCMLAPSVNTTDRDVTYLWECNGCFANGMTAMVITQSLTDMDTSMINCLVTVDNDTFMTDTPFDLRVTQGIFICVIIMTKSK